VSRFTLAVTLAALVCGGALSVHAQDDAAADEGMAPHVAIVSIYHVAPGKQLDFLRWMAAREAVDVSLGLDPGQWYAHMDGASWDFVGIAPERSAEEDAKIDAALKEKGLTTGFAAALELRQVIASHTDTFAAGPHSAAELVAAAAP